MEEAVHEGEGCAQIAMFEAVREMMGKDAQRRAQEADPLLMQEGERSARHVAPHPASWVRCTDRGSGFIGGQSAPSPQLVALWTARPCAQRLHERTQSNATCVKPTWRRMSGTV